MNFLLVIESRDFKLCQKINKNFFGPILMKLGMMLEVNETFMTIWLPRSSKVRVKVRWPQSPIGTIFIPFCYQNCHSLNLILPSCISWLLQVETLLYFCLHWKHSGIINQLTGIGSPIPISTDVCLILIFCVLFLAMDTDMPTEGWQRVTVLN